MHLLNFKRLLKGIRSKRRKRKRKRLRKEKRGGGRRPGGNVRAIVEQLTARVVK